MDIRQEIQRKRVTQAFVAKAAGIDESLLSRLLKGDRQWKTEQLEKVRGVLRAIEKEEGEQTVFDLILKIVDKMDLPPDKSAPLIMDLTRCHLATGIAPSLSLARKLSMLRDLN